MEIIFDIILFIGNLLILLYCLFVIIFPIIRFLKDI